MHDCSYDTRRGVLPLASTGVPYETLGVVHPPPPLRGYREGVLFRFGFSPDPRTTVGLKFLDIEIDTRQGVLQAKVYRTQEPLPG